jgi:hypothetical protein
MEGSAATKRRSRTQQTYATAVKGSIKWEMTIADIAKQELVEGEEGGGGTKGQPFY